MPDPTVTVVIPTLRADSTLLDCVRSLAAQTWTDFEVVVIDNSGQGRAGRIDEVRQHARVIENKANVGFGAAVNQGIRDSASPFIFTLNDDAIPHPECLAALMRATAQYETGMCAPRIMLMGEDRLDSAGMLICRDGSSKQRGHLEPAERYARRKQVLLPSGCAALYRRDMLDEIGLFDERFFLYCEDTDLGLRARWKLWECVYVPEAVVEHRYSHSAGRASTLKAFYVERNRLFLAVKNFPLRELAAVPFVSLWRYFWHAFYLVGGKGKAAEHAAGEGGPATLFRQVLRAWLAVVPALPHLVAERRRIRRGARIDARQFLRMLRSYRISARQVAAL